MDSAQWLHFTTTTGPIIERTRPHISCVESNALDCVCRQCRKAFTISLPDAPSALTAWLSGGVVIQRAMPSLTADERELIMSGTCGPCFDAMFGDA